MYLDFYGFREKPFSLTPDPRFIFLSKNHREAFAHLLYGINERAGFIVMTGQVGSGKTTVLRALLGQLDPDHYRTALIFNPCFSAPELLQSVNREFGVAAEPANPPTLLETLNHFLLEQNAHGRIVVLIIDEAQTLEAPVLEQIRLISNLETDREKLIQIVLAGQPEFMQTLNRKDMQQLSQRITVRYHLLPMDFQDTVDYIHYRLEVAGGKGRVFFSQRALKRIYRHSGGLPRLINATCDRALLAGYIRDSAKISSGIARAGIQDVRSKTAAYPGGRSIIMVPAFVVLATLFVAGTHFEGLKLIDRFNPSHHVEAIEEPPPRDPLLTGEEFYRAMAAELGKVPESESARRAFNTLATLWKVQPLPESGNFDKPNEMERAASGRNLRVYRFFGNLGALIRMGYPAALELTLPGIPGKRFVSLVGMEEEKLVIDPPIAGRKSLTFGELERHWSGHAFLLWKDPLNLLPNVSPGARGSHVKQLQGLLQEARAYNRPLTGVYDRDTVSAVKEFQSLRGIEQDGIVGGQTLMLMYRSIDRFEIPKLTAGQK